MKLYELNQNWKNLEELLENTDDENIKELVKEGLKNLEGDLITKCENICKLIKNYEADVKSYKDEEKRLATQRKVYENKIEGLKEYLFQSVRETKNKKVETSIFKLGVRKSPPKVILDDESKIDDKYKIIKFEYDKKALKEELKKGEVEGCHLEQGESLTIK